MTRKNRNVIGFVVLIALCMPIVSFGDEVSWNAAMQAANPLHWYKFDEPIITDPNFADDPNCYDYGSAGLDGSYGSFVELEQEGAFGPGKAVRFEAGNLTDQYEDIMYTGGGTLDTPEWSAQFIVKKASSNEGLAQALCDSADFSIRLVGWYTGERLSFTEYGVYDAEFDPVPGQSLIVPTMQWSHITFRKDATGTQVFINGVVVGTTTLNIDLPIQTFGGRESATSDGMDGWLDEAVVFNRRLTDFEIAKHNHAYNPLLVPDTFELYEDTPSLNSLWSGTNAALELATDETYAGLQSMKAVFGTGGGSILKDVPMSWNCLDQAGKSLEVKYKGDPANTEGTVTVSTYDSEGALIASQTTDTTTSADWRVASLLVDLDRDNLDPNSLWNDVDTLKIEVSGAGSVYFDEIDFVAPSVPLQKVLQWDFDHTEGRTVIDSVNGVHGVLDYVEPAVWVEDGGHTGEIGDHALYMGPDPNYFVVAYNVTAPEDVAALFAADMDFSINMWVKFDDTVGSAMLGGFGLGKTSEAQPADAGTNRYLGYTGGNGVIFWPHYGDVLSNDWTSMGNWHMMTATYNAWDRFARVYLDGKEVGKGIIDGGLADALPQISISPLGYDWGSYFEGLVDDFSLWQGILPAEDRDGDPTNDILSMWGSWICPDGAQPPLDYDGDCVVNIGDLAAIGEEWMVCGRRPLDMCD
jgi:hypothetical protein